MTKTEDFILALVITFAVGFISVFVLDKTKLSEWWKGYIYGCLVVSAYFMTLIFTGFYS